MKEIVGKWQVAGGRWQVAVALLLLPFLYGLTMAHSLVLGDPTEYTLVANVLGVAHPPGYAFITLVGKLFQSLIPIGSIPWRMSLVSVTAASLAAFFVYGAVYAVVTADRRPPTANGNIVTPTTPDRTAFIGRLAALFAALVVGTAADFWQHAIHPNPHILTATFLAANLFFLTRWQVAGGRWQVAGGRSKIQNPDRWLYAFCFSAGLGVTHHPLTVLAFPAYALFILWVRPGLWRQGRTLLMMVLFALLGLSVWLYFPIRSAMRPVFGPHDMNTLDGFLNVVLARGLRVNLFHFGLRDQPDRALVFWSLLRLQYALPTLFLALLGLIHPFQNPKSKIGQVASSQWRVAGSRWQVISLYVLAFLLNYGFVINTVQDVMAYLLGPFLIVGLLAGMGLFNLLDWVDRRLAGSPMRHPPNTQHTTHPTPYALRMTHDPFLLFLSLFLLGPVLQVVRNLPAISLRDYEEGAAYVEAVFSYFTDRQEGAILLNDWERMTPLWYTRFVEKRWPDPADVRPEFVSTARPWLPSVFDFLPGGPVYLNGYRREIVEAGFRLRPAGPFYQVVEPGDTTIPAALEPVRPPAVAGDLEIVAFSLPEQSVEAGDFVPLTLAMRAPAGTADYYAPVVRVGPLILAFTTDSHLITPLWRPGEVIVERFDFALPPNLPTGSYPVTLQMSNLSMDGDSGLRLPLGELPVTGQAYPIRTGHLLANFRQRVGLAAAVARQGGQRRKAPWDEPLVVQAGDVVHLTLAWQSLAPAEESYTVFVHLIDQGNQLVAPPLDYTPLGGAAPTHLWIPKWLPGQRYHDPYRLPIPADLLPGTYLIEVGLYEMTSGRRLHISDAAGNLAGDRFIVGSVRVEG